MQRNHESGSSSRSWTFAVTLQWTTQRHTRGLDQEERNREHSDGKPASSTFLSWLRQFGSNVVGIIARAILDFLIKITFYSNQSRATACLASAWGLPGG